VRSPMRGGRPVNTAGSAAFAHRPATSDTQRPAQSKA
jgi:hypothetical protein